MRCAFLINQYVPRFDIAMQNTVLVSEMNGPRQLRDQLHRAADRHLLAPDCFVDLTAFDEVHAEVAIAIPFTNFVNWNNVWMVQSRCCFCFETKPFQMP